MNGIKVNLETLAEVAKNRNSWNYAPAWLSPSGVWYLPPDVYGDGYKQTCHASFRVTDRAGYIYNWEKGYVRVEFPRLGGRLAVESGFTPVQRLPRRLKPAHKAALREAVLFLNPCAVKLPGLGEIKNHAKALEVLS